MHLYLQVVIITTYNIQYTNQKLTCSNMKVVWLNIILMEWNIVLKMFYK